MWQDLRSSFRILHRAPGFSAAAILTLAPGIGASTAIFSLADAVLLRPLPYPHSSRLVMVWDKLTRYNLPRRSPEYHTADAYRRLDGIFDSTGGVFWYDTTLVRDSGAERVSLMTVSPEIFEMLAPRAALGRIFAPEEYRTSADPSVVLGNALFVRVFGGDASILGKSVTVAGRSRRVIGVMAPDFDFSMSAGSVDVWIPVPLDTRMSWGNATRMLARLKPGVSLDAAQAALSAAARHVDKTEHPYRGPNGEDAGYGVTVVSLHDQFFGEYRSPAILLMSAVAFLLLIACVNVANLLLVRAISREKETAVRRALGATTARLTAQWTAESAMLAVLGAALGSVIAMWGVKLLVRVGPAALNGMNSSAPTIGSGIAAIGVDPRAFAFTLGVACVVCVLFGLAPALASGPVVGGFTRRRRRTASIMVASEVALAVVLMIGAGLLLKSFSRLTAVDPGFNPSHLLTLRTGFPRQSTLPQRAAFYETLRETLAALPGVTAATVGPLPVRGGGINARSGDLFGIQGSAATQFAALTPIGVDYFRTFEIPMQSGRAFTPADSEVVIVNETLARTFFPQGAVGRQIGVPPPCRDTKCELVWMPIVGVAGDVKTRTLDLAAQPQIYLPQGTDGLILRTAGDPMSMAATVAKVIHSADPAMSVFDVRTMQDRISDTVGQPRFQSFLLTSFACAALFLAGIGIFGVVAHSTAQRTQEIGVRIALGAGRARVMQTVLLDGLRPVICGVALGILGGFVLASLIRSGLFQVSQTDPPSFLLAAAVVMAVAIAACLIPARRAAAIDPIGALHHE